MTIFLIQRNNISITRLAAMPQKPFPSSIINWSELWFYNRKDRHGPIGPPVPGAVRVQMGVSDGWCALPPYLHFRDALPACGMAPGKLSEPATWSLHFTASRDNWMNILITIIIAIMAHTQKGFAGPALTPLAYSRFQIQMTPKTMNSS